MESKKYKYDEKPEGNIICEPLVKYGTLVLDPAKRYSYADYLTWVDDKRRELFDGFVRMMAGPLTIHSEITAGIFGSVWSFIRRRKGQCKIFHSPIDVRLPENGEIADDKIFTVVQPDIVVVCDLSKIDERGIIGAPDLVVEVLSPSNARLMMSTKFDLYERAGVKEYWVVYPKSGVTVFLLQDNGKYDNGTTYDVVYSPDAKIPVHTIKGLEIGLKELFED